MGNIGKVITDTLLKSSFADLECFPISEEEVKDILGISGIAISFSDPQKGISRSIKNRFRASGTTYQFNFYDLYRFIVVRSLFVQSFTAISEFNTLIDEILDEFSLTVDQINDCDRWISVGEMEDIVFAHLQCRRDAWRSYWLHDGEVFDPRAASKILIGFWIRLFCLVCKNVPDFRNEFSLDRPRMVMRNSIH